MGFFKSKSKKTPEETLEEGILVQLKLGAEKTLLDVCRENPKFLIEAVKTGSADKITAALRKVGRFSPENLEDLYELHEQYLANLQN